MITQQEFEQIMKFKKQFKESEQISLSNPWSKEIISLESNDTFILDFSNRGPIELRKFKYNKRYRQSIILLRFESSGKHTNPEGTDGKVFEGPHIHIYKEGYDDKWAFPVSKIGIENIHSTKSQILVKFLEYCNVSNYPIIQDNLF